MKTIDAQNVDEALNTAEIGETGSAKLAANGDLLVRREENADWRIFGTVEAEDRNDVLSILHDRGVLHGTWTPLA